MAADADDADDRGDAEGAGWVDPDDLPSSDLAVEAHVHFAMTGSFPLRMAELFFTDAGVYVAEYSYITPLFGLGTGKHRKDAEAMQALYDRYGIDAALLHADRLVWYDYATVDRVDLYTGGRFGRAKIDVVTGDDSPAYRLLGDRSFDAVSADVRAAAERHGVDVDVRDELGFSPRESVRRFFAR